MIICPSHFIWENFLPEYGKTADRKEVFLLFHHPRYGLVPNVVPVYVLSDSTYRAGIIKLEDRYNTRVLSGRLVIAIGRLEHELGDEERLRPSARGPGDGDADGGF